MTRLGFVGLFLLCARGALGDVDSLWPLPSSVANLNGNSINLDSSFLFFPEADYGDVVNNAISRYADLINVPQTSSGGLTECTLRAESADIGAIIGADESYHILTSNIDGTCSISATTIWGLLRGMETFSQLLVRDTETVKLVYGDVDINDEPRFPHRGLMIDTARHFISVDTIKKVIDSLPINKFNVLHWHTVDAESFPLKTPSEPTMSNGAFSPEMTYSMEQLQELVAYAYERAVEVIFEVDVPGHAAAWTKGYPSIMAQCFEKYSYNINDFALNPTLDETYTVLSGILSDLLAAAAAGTQQAQGSSNTNTIIPHGSRVHLGGDEVVYGCWAEDASIVAFMDEQGWTSYDQLMNYFVTKADDIVVTALQPPDVDPTTGAGNKVHHWEEVFKAGCDVSRENAVFQVWTDASMINSISAAQYNVLASPSNYWYLNIATNTWQVMYGYEPTSNLTSPSTQTPYIQGGETALWSEYIDDNNMLQNIYPRAAAVAERLWSPQNTTDVDGAEDRLLVQRCRLINRGIASSPVGPAGYCDLNYV